MVDIHHDGSLAEEPLMLNDTQIDDLVTNSGATVHLVESWVQEGAERDVLQWEFTLGRVLDPATQSCRLCFNHKDL